jgi:hypothetical protein
MPAQLTWQGMLNTGAAAGRQLAERQRPRVQRVDRCAVTQAISRFTKRLSRCGRFTDANAVVCNAAAGGHNVAKEQVRPGGMSLIASVPCAGFASCNSRHSSRPQVLGGKYVWLADNKLCSSHIQACGVHSCTQPPSLSPSCLARSIVSPLSGMRASMPLAFGGCGVITFRTHMPSGLGQLRQQTMAQMTQRCNLSVKIRSCKHHRLI